MDVASSSYRVAVIVGSLRKASLSRKLANALLRAAPPALAFDTVEIGDLPLYNEDLERDAPAAWTRFRKAVRACDGVLFVTPEYNRSVPGCLKNALDVGSRPYGHSVFSGRPAAVVSQSPGAMGGFGANHALRQSLVFLDMPALQQPEAYISDIAKLFNEAGDVTDARTQAFLASIMQAFAAWLARNALGFAPAIGSAADV